MAMDMDIEMDLDVNPTDNFTSQELGLFVGVPIFHLG
jgi:hypothetical protein